MLEKHSLTLQQHRTSVSLEPEFWAEFRRLAKLRGVGINQLATEIDNARDQNTNLASAIRLYILRSAMNAQRNS